MDDRHTPYDDVSNQQDATTFSSSNLFKLALHVSGDKFAHPQEHFWGGEVLLRMVEFVTLNMYS